MTVVAAVAPQNQASERTKPPRRRVLLVAYHFPPEPAAGSLRPSYLARYLPDFGWDVSVLTKRRDGVDAAAIAAPDIFEPFMRQAQNARPATSQAEAAREEDKKRHRTLAATMRDVAKNMLFFPDRAAGWIPGAIAAGLKETRRYGFDAVISTGPPQSAHVVAYAVARARKLPWIADFRDLWHGNPYAAVKGRLRTAIERGMEAALRRRASAITAVHPDLIARQERTYGRSFSEVIPAAYDPSEWQGLEDPEPFGFRLCYAGTLYEGRRRLDLLLDAVGTLRAMGHPAGLAARIDYYGPDDALVHELASQRGLSDAVTCNGNIPHADVLPALRRAAVLLILLDMRLETVSQLGSKIFEYIGAKRPVLAIGPAGSAVQHFISRHQIGWFAADQIEAQAAIRAAYKAVTTGNARHMVNGANETIPTARDVAARFASLLDSVLAGGQRGLY